MKRHGDRADPGQRGSSGPGSPTSPGRSPGRSPGWATCSAPGARAYEATFGRLLEGLYRRMAADLAMTSRPERPEHVVDVGAGPGGLACAVARCFPDARITAIDIDPQMAALARARILREGLGDRLHVVVGDVATLPLPEASVDLVTSSFSVHHWPDAGRGFAQIRRVLRPGGRAVVYDVPDSWGRFETRSRGLARAATAGGFASSEVTSLAWPAGVRVVRRIVVER